MAGGALRRLLTASRSTASGRRLLSTNSQGAGMEGAEASGVLARVAALVQSERLVSDK
jgi:hypothetical protein